jgi:acetyltransferase EpsM
MDKLVIWGASGHARVVADIIRLQGRYDIAGFILDASEGMSTNSFLGLPVLGGRDILKSLAEQDIRYGIAAIGHCPIRNELAQLVEESGLRLATAIHPSAIIARGVRIGEGSVIAAGAIINPGSDVGKNVILNTCSSVDHDCTIKDGAHLCPGVRLAGGVEIGQESWTGIGSVVVSGVEIGEGTFVGAGSLVIENLPSWTLCYGTPASPVRELDRRWSGLDLSGAPAYT